MIPDSPVYSTSWDGKKRALYPSRCEFCHDWYYVPQKELKRTKYCSKNCNNRGRRKRVKVNCAQCGSDIEKTPSKLKNSKSGLFFCNRTCKEEAQKLGGIKQIQPNHYGNGNGKWTYRERALSKYGKLCNKCGYSKDVRMLDVDHIDSDRSNNKIENLQVLCVWCHGLKTRKIKDFHLPGV